MNKQELVDACRHYLRLSVAGTLNIPAGDYRGSLQAQTAVKRCVTNIMSLGYNEELSDAFDEVLTFRFFGEPLSEKQCEEVLEELRASRNTFQNEISAYRYAVRSFDEGNDPAEILEEVKRIAPLREDYALFSS